MYIYKHFCNNIIIYSVVPLTWFIQDKRPQEHKQQIAGFLELGPSLCTTILKWNRGQR